MLKRYVIAAALGCLGFAKWGSAFWFASIGYWEISAAISLVSLLAVLAYAVHRRQRLTK